jgi:hypothetical protein
MRKVPTHRPKQSSIPVHKPRPAARSAEDAAWKAWIDGSVWKRMREFYRRRHPWCEWCASLGIHEPMVDVHHTRGHDPAYRLDATTLYSLCKSCHGRITAMERAGTEIVYPARQPTDISDDPCYG